MLIVPGEIRVSAALLVLDQPHARIWHLDLDSKYAQVLSYTAQEVLLIADERTMGVDEALRGRPTAVAVKLPQGWNVMVDCSRYTCRIIGYRQDQVRDDQIYLVDSADTPRERARQTREENLRRTDMLLAAGHPLTCNGGNPDVASHHDHEVIMEWTIDNDLHCPQCGRVQPMGVYD